MVAVVMDQPAFLTAVPHLPERPCGPLELLSNDLWKYDVRDSTPQWRDGRAGSPGVTVQNCSLLLHRPPRTPKRPAYGRVRKVRRYRGPRFRPLMLSPRPSTRSPFTQRRRTVRFPHEKAVNSAFPIFVRGVLRTHTFRIVNRLLVTIDQICASLPSNLPLPVKSTIKT